MQVSSLKSQLRASYSTHLPGSSRLAHGVLTTWLGSDVGLFGLLAANNLQPLRLGFLNYAWVECLDLRHVSARRMTAALRTSALNCSSFECNSFTEGLASRAFIFCRRSRQTLGAHSAPGGLEGGPDSCAVVQDARVAGNSPQLHHRCRGCFR